MRSLVVFLLCALSLHAQTSHVRTRTPRAAKHGEERTPFLTSAGTPCGNLAHIDTLWYFYYGTKVRITGTGVSNGFETRAEAVKWGTAICPKQGKAAVK